MLSDTLISLLTAYKKYLINLNVCDKKIVPGVVVIADAAQSICPATGTGLSKVMTDVDLLLDDYINRWISTPGMAKEKMHDFYSDPRKMRSDENSLATALRRRGNALIETDFGWRMMHFRRDVSSHIHSLRARYANEPA